MVNQQEDWLTDQILNASTVEQHVTSLMSAGSPELRRKVCVECGSTNHLSIDCKTVPAPISNFSPSQLLMPNLAPPNLPALSAHFSAMPFMNPLLAYNMNFAMPWNMNMNPDNNPYASQFINAMNSELSKIEPVNVPLTKS